MSLFGEELARLRSQSLLRTLRRTDSAQGPRVTLDGREVVLLSSNDYLGLASHPALGEAVVKAVERFGVGAGASRLISGNTALHEQLERRIAAFKETEAALLFNTGYAANTGVIPTLASEGDVILSDELNHASIIDGCRLSRARTIVYRHCDPDSLADGLRRSSSARRRLIVTDGVFSMDGDIAPLAAIAGLADAYDAIVLVDDAHAAGVLGRRGRGSIEYAALTDAGRIIQMGTLGKAFGVFGAYIAGSADVVRYLISTARSFLFSTALPPAICSAALAAIDIIEREPERRQRLWANRNDLIAGLRQAEIPIGATATPIIPILIGDAAKALAAAERLLEYGVYAPAIRPPTVPAGSSRIRVTVTAAHNSEDIAAAVAAFKGLRDDGCIP